MKKWKSVTEWISIIIVMYYVSVRFYESSRFSFAFFEQPRIIIVGIPVFLATMIRFFPCFLDNWIRETDKWKVLAKPLLGMAFAIPCLFVAYKYKYHFLIYLAVIPFCLYEIEINKILKVFTFTVGIILSTTILCSLIGVIDNQFTASVSEGHMGSIRGRYGIASATDLAAYFFFVLASFWMSREEKMDRWNTGFTILLSLLASVGIWFFTRTRTSIILCLLLTLLIVFDAYVGKHIGKGTIRARKIVDTIAVWSLPILGLLFFGLTWLYGHGNTIAIKFDRIIDARFRYAWESVQKYGIHPLGALTPQHGWGGDSIQQWQGTYDFLDSTFALFLIRYGWVLTVIIIFLWSWMTKNALKMGRRRIAYSMMAIAVHCFVEHHFPELNYNILLATPFCILSSSMSMDKVKAVDSEKRRWIPWLTAFIEIGAILFLLPDCLSRMRAVVAVEGWTNNEYSSINAVVLIVGAIVLIILLWFSLSKILSLLIKKERVQKKLILGTLVSLLFLFGIQFIAEKEIDTTIFDDQMNEDTPAVELILATKTQPVYVDQKEEFYKRRFSGIEDRIDSVEAISRERSGTVLLDKKESYVLLHTGAVYAEISENSGLYTYDEAVIESLRKAGYSVRGYYFSENNLDLGTIAKRNKIQKNGTESLVLNSGTAFIESPDLSLYSGDYLITFELSIDPYNALEEICDFEISAYFGEDIIEKVQIYADEFDEYGNLSKKIPFTIKGEGSRLGSAGIRFTIYPNAPIEIKKISYKRNPSYDIWQSFDSYYRVTSEFFFDANGKPAKTNKGYYGIEYEYDGDSTSWLLCRFLDESGKPMMCTDGYAMIARSFDGLGRFVEEQYLDTDGKLCCTKDNYALYKRGFDKKGNVNKYSYFDDHYSLVINRSGYAIMIKEYDNEQRVIKESYYGINQEPIVLPRGFSSKELQYDNAGHLIMESYYGTNGEPVIIWEGYSVVKYFYDNHSVLVREEYYGIDEKVVELNEKQ